MTLLGILASVAIYAAWIGTFYGIFTIVYRIRFHPLRRCPGPLLGAITDAYGGYLAWRRSDHLAIHQLHEHYGSVVRLAPDRLVFNSLQAFQDIYQNPRCTKSFLYLYSRDKNQPTTFSTIEAEAHRERRKLISQPISQRAMRLFEPTMLKQIDIFLRQIYRSSSDGKVENLTDRAEWLGIDIIGILSFGYHLNLQTDETYRFIPRSFADIKARINTFMQFPLLSWFAPVITYFTEPEKDKLLKMVFMMMKSRAEREVDQDADRDFDFYSHAKGSLDYGPEYFEYGEFMAEAAFFVTAGGTPPATVICALIFYLMRYPDCYGRLCEEIRTTFKSGNEIRGEGGGQLMGCRYLRACIDETMRMSPPSLTTLWREQDKDDTDDSPFIVDGLVIPRGVQVGMNMYSLHHNEDYFPDSFVFSPERWYDEGEEKKNVEQAFVPFLQGTRSCAGKAMAYYEISLVVAKMLWYFDIESAPGKAGELGEGIPGRRDGRHRVREYQMEDCNSATHDGPNVVFKLRSGVEAEFVE
ncbi:cytochrome P450 [Poronia punctata]|nr:cytochrome P450 [Poronia punctata]